jgi:hypothetical protein
MYPFVDSIRHRKEIQGVVERYERRRPHPGRTGGGYRDGLLADGGDERRGVPGHAKDVLVSDQVDSVEDAGVFRRRDLPGAQVVAFADRLQLFPRYLREIR